MVRELNSFWPETIFEQSVACDKLDLWNDAVIFSTRCAVYGYS